MEAPRAYDLWASSYDEQHDNPLLPLDGQLLESLLWPTDLRRKVVLDIGCGTGRHWERLFAEGVADLIGYDASPGMLLQLRKKFPGAVAYAMVGNTLSHTPDESCDLLLSTLTLGYIGDLQAAFAEWSRVVRRGGNVVITDMHPDVATTGARSFHHGGRNVSIRHHAHSLDTIRAAAAAHGFDTLECEERTLMYGMRFRKR